MSDINFHDAIGGQLLGVLAVQYDPADPTITLAASLPAHIVADGPIVDLSIGGQEFKGTAFSVGNTVIAVTADPQTADTTHVVGTPVYLILAKSTMIEFRDQPFVTDGDVTADLPNSVDVNGLTLPPADHDHSANTTEGGASISPATLIVPAATAPAQTAEGSAVWDSNDDKLTVGTGAGRKTLVNDDDSRLTDDRDPTVHAATHETGGGDVVNPTEAEISLSDVTTLNASTARHGFLKKLSNTATEFMDGTGNWSTPAGGSGGGSSLSYLGTNAIGVSNENVTNLRAYQKKITVPTGGGIVTSIGAYLSQSTDNAFSMGVAIMSDNAGVPDELLAMSQHPPIADSGGDAVGGWFALETAATPTYAPTWLHVPIGKRLDAGDYWIVVMFSKPAGTLNLAYDGGGSDRYYTANNLFFTHEGRFTGNTTTNNYSVRADFIGAGGGGTAMEVLTYDGDALWDVDANGYKQWLYREV